MSVREVAKAIARLAAHLAASPFLLVHALKVPLLGKDRALEGSTQCISLLPGVCGQYIRGAFLAWTIRECHPSATVSFGVIFSKTSASIGAFAYIGPYSTFGDVSVERDVLIASGVQILSGGRIHGTADPTRPIREQPGEITHVTVGAGAWIGAGAIVMADIGRNSIVGAGAVVTKAIPEGVVAVGVPAKVVRPRFNSARDPQSE
jgi:acetyltransferase-like isoleucine patch superfamily enzyme